MPRTLETAPGMTHTKNAFFGSKRFYLSLSSKTHCFIEMWCRCRSSLCRLLSEGLDRALHTADRRSLADFFSVEVVSAWEQICLYAVATSFLIYNHPCLTLCLQHSFSTLQSHLIEFTKRLHAAEVEKRDLRHHEASLKSDVERLNAHTSY